MDFRLLYEALEIKKLIKKVMPELKYKSIVIFGPQASGKGTQADALSEKFNIPHISTGAIFREEILIGTELGKKVGKLINGGNLVPDDITNEIAKKRLNEPDVKNGFVMEGYPRNIEQAEFLEGLAKIDLALEIWISDEEAVMRIGGRRSCKKCGAIYHVKFNPAKTEGRCDKCRGELVLRDDDGEQAVRARLRAYHEQTEPLIEFYKERGVYQKIDGMPPIGDVTRQILDVFEK